MKKIITLLIIYSLLFISLTPIKASESLSILIHIENAKDLYLIQLQEKTMKVQIISSSLYLPIPALKEERAMIKEVNFKNNYASLLTTINKAFNKKIQYYVSLDMPALLKHLNLKNNSYDYQSLDSLCKVSKTILAHLNIPTLIDYQSYIDTNLGYQQLYDLYKYFKKDDFTTKYYSLQYFVVNKKYLLLNKDFYRC